MVNLIVSSPDVGINFYGLTEKGKQQAKEVCHQSSLIFIVTLSYVISK